VRAGADLRSESAFESDPTEAPTRALLKASPALRQT
jgi:hypothetical protein